MRFFAASLTTGLINEMQSPWISSNLFEDYLSGIQLSGGYYMKFSRDIWEKLVFKWNAAIIWSKIILTKVDL